LQLSIYCGCGVPKIELNLFLVFFQSLICWQYYHFYWDLSTLVLSAFFAGLEFSDSSAFLELKISIFRISSEDGVIFARILFTLLAIIFVYSGLIYQVEHPANPESFGTFLDAVYFSVVTMTTVGFGDVTPISESGRFLTILMILTGIALIPWQLGDLIKQLVKSANHGEAVCKGCGWSVHDANARFCKMCGSQLDNG
jgi:voltage-gated potassium channel